MRIPSGLVSLAVRALAESMSVDTMAFLARRVIENYDLHERTGFPATIPIPNRDAARRILSDMRDSELFPHFAGLLVEIDRNGLMGRRYRIAQLRGLIKGLAECGFVYDQENSMFVEDATARRTRNWGVLREGSEYIFAFLRIDVVGSSGVVRRHSRDVVQRAYSELRDLVQTATAKRNGRVWAWEGDGGLVAFFFGNRNLSATMTAMEILHELFLYNRIGCPLDGPMTVRMAVHNGPCEYTENEERLTKHETVKKTLEIEGDHTTAGTVTVSNVVYSTLGPRTMRHLSPINTDPRTTHYSYGLRWEE